MKTTKILLSVLLAFGTLCSNAQKEKKGTIYLVSDAHFDTQWLWDVQTSIDVYLKNTLTQNLYLLERYPEFIFNFEGGIKYAWMKEYYPREYAKVNEYVRSGRWHVSGASWDATDTNIPSTESFFRNILLGQQFYKNEFGIKSTDIFLPDCFGFGYTLPTIASHCGLIGFSTQKLGWRLKPFYGDSKIPFRYGIWEGVDGSEILAVTDARGYTKKFHDGDVSINKELIEVVENSPNNKGYHYFGTGDRGGAPTIATVESITEGILDGKGPINVRCVPSDELFKEYLPFSDHPELPRFNGELLMDTHGTGCYTSQAAMKRYNRANEVLADAAERASVISEWLGGTYPANKLNDAWKRFIWHQFHDDLTGTSIPEAYQFSWNDELISQTQFADILTTASKEVASMLNTAVSGSPVIVFNSLGRQRKDQVHTFVPMATKPAGVNVISDKGVKVNAQLLSYVDGMAEIVFTAEVAPMSYSVYDIRPASADAKSSVLKFGKNWIENSVYKVTLDNNGDIASIVDKRNGRELVAKDKPMRLAVINGNESSNWPAWEIYKKAIDTPSVAIDEDVKITVAEKGKARVALKVEKKYNNSTFVYYVSLTDGGADDRIDVRLDIDWCQKDALLKAEFPMNVSNPMATYDLGIGTIQRCNNTETAYEVPAQQWADITAEDKSYGVSIITDYKVGWDKPADNTLRLTLLHTPHTPKRHPHSNTQDFGTHSLTYSIIGHENDLVSAGIPFKADSKNNIIYTFNTTKHKGVLGKNFSMLKVNDPNIEIKAFKKSENDNEYILRVYETANKGVKDAVVEFVKPIEVASETNGIEERIGDAKFEGNKLYITTAPYRPKTYSVRLKKNSTPMRPVQCKKLELDYNAPGYTNDGFMDIANIDGRGNSYTYDLLPKELDHNGIPFSFGKLGYNNVIKCDGKSIKIPEGNQYKTLYLLVASMTDDKLASFNADGKIYSYDIPYYSGFYGQWGWVTETGPGYLRDASLAYVGTHRHNVQKGNESYVYTYMYRIAVPVGPDTKEVILPDDPEIVVFAATLADEESGTFTAGTEFRAVP